MSEQPCDAEFELHIRRAKKDDIQKIIELFNDGAPEGASVRVAPDELRLGYVEAFERIDADPKQHLMVAEVCNEVIGTFQMTFLTFLAGAGLDDCQIESVHVARRWRTRGIGTRMIEWAIDEAKKHGCRRVQLTTDKRRVAAHRFYERFGFELSHEGAKLWLASR